MTDRQTQTDGQKWCIINLLSRSACW